MFYSVVYITTYKNGIPTLRAPFAGLSWLKLPRWGFWLGAVVGSQVISALTGLLWLLSALRWAKSQFDLGSPQAQVSKYFSYFKKNWWIKREYEDLCLKSIIKFVKYKVSPWVLGFMSSYVPALAQLVPLMRGESSEIEKVLTIFSKMIFTGNLL